jgi:hypothetical protein
MQLSKWVTVGYGVCDLGPDALYDKRGALHVKPLNIQKNRSGDYGLDLLCVNPLNKNKKS